MGIQQKYCTLQQLNTLQNKQKLYSITAPSLPISFLKLQKIKEINRSKIINKTNGDELMIHGTVNTSLSFSIFYLRFSIKELLQIQLKQSLKLVGQFQLPKILFCLVTSTNLFCILSQKSQKKHQNQRIQLFYKHIKIQVWGVNCAISLGKLKNIKLIQKQNSQRLWRYTFLEKSSLNYQKEIEIYLVSTNTNQKQILLVFSLSFISERDQANYLLSLNSIQNILQIHNFFAASIQQKQLILICHLITHPSSAISNLAISLFDNIIFHNQQSSDVLVKHGILLNKLYERLQIEINSDQNFQCQSITFINCILSNTLLGDSKIIKIIEVHPIWQLICQGIHSASKFLPLITTFQYYFEYYFQYYFNKLDRKTLCKVFARFLYVISSLQLHENTPLNRKIKQIVLSIYLTAQQYWQSEFQMISNEIHSNSLFWIIKQLQ